MRPRKKRRVSEQGRWLHAIRLRRRLTAQACAAYVGVPTRRWHYWEEQGLENVGHILLKIAEALGVPPQWLLSAGDDTSFTLDSLAVAHAPGVLMSMGESAATRQQADHAKLARDEAKVQVTTERALQEAERAKIAAAAVARREAANEARRLKQTAYLMIKRRADYRRSRRTSYPMICECGEAALLYRGLCEVCFPLDSPPVEGEPGHLAADMP